MERNTYKEIFSETFAMLDKSIANRMISCFENNPSVIDTARCVLDGHYKSNKTPNIKFDFVYPVYEILYNNQRTSVKRACKVMFRKIRKKYITIKH